jgi:hypothetical protein
LNLILLTNKACAREIDYSQVAGLLPPPALISLLAEPKIWAAVGIGEFLFAIVKIRLIFALPLISASQLSVHFACSVSQQPTNWHQHQHHQLAFFSFRTTFFKCSFRNSLKLVL